MKLYTLLDNVTFRQLWRENKVLFVFSMWFFSRLVLIIGMQLIAPLLPLAPINSGEPGLDTAQVKDFLPHLGWELFTHWDGEHYRNIASKGYTYAISHIQNNIAFFPVYPLAVQAFMFLGVPFNTAGTILSNMTFLAVLLVFHRWINRFYSQSIARWSTAVLAWFPLSLFCSLSYTESFFLLFTISALNSFEKQKYGWASVFGMLATATRPPGIVLIPTLLLFSWLEGRTLIAYLSALSMSGGIIAFSLFCWIKFNEPFAFIQAQSGWPQPSWVQLGQDIIMPVFTTSMPFYIYAVAITLMVVIGILIFRYPTQGYLAMGVLGMLLSAYLPTFLQILMPLTSVWLMWYFRQQLNRIFLIYGWCSLGFLFLSGTKASIHRHIYVIVPLSLALGILLSRYPRAGYIAMSMFGFLLMLYSVRFAWWDWIG
jgi:Gpi18-like mannosyltransferase